MDPREAVKYEFVRYTRGLGLDLGSGPAGCFPQFIKVRRRDDDAHRAAGARFYEVDDFAKLTDFESASCDFIVAAGTFRVDWNASDAIDEWLRCIKVGGHLCIYEPAPEMEAHQRFAFLAHQASLNCPLALERLETWHGGGTFMVIRKRDWGDGHLSFEDYSEIPNGGRPEKTVCIVRHGGIGDQIQAAFLLPELKRQGYHVTVLTTEKGKAVLANDPHVDDWFIVDHDHVPNIELPAFWRTIARHYSKFVNLNEAVEGTFLPAPGRPAHAWPLAVRQKRLNVNYAEFAAELAEIPFKPEGRFYPTADEKQWADGFLRELSAAPAEGWVIGMQVDPVYVIMWVLSGSSPHKFTPHQDTVIKMVLGRLKRAVIVMVGDEACKILQVGWDDEPRIVQLSGDLDLRKTLTLAREVDMVIGPETGILNSVAYHERVRKVVLLSHSSHENLTKHWVNTDVIAGKAPCFPCHQLHFTSEFCPQDKVTGAALCQQGVPPTDIYHPIDRDYTGWVRAKTLRAA